MAWFGYIYIMAIPIKHEPIQYVFIWITGLRGVKSVHLLTPLCVWRPGDTSKAKFKEFEETLKEMGTTYGQRILRSY